MKTASQSRRVANVLFRPALWFCACNLLAAVLAAQCSNPTQVNSQTDSSGTNNYSDNNALSASSVVVNGSASMTLAAGNCIQLLPGFHATAGTAPTTFHAWVEAVPTAVSVSPSSGSGLSQAFTSTVSSPSGAGDIASVQLLFNNPYAASNACWVYYNAASNTLSLRDNTGTTWSNTIVAGQVGSLSNSQCTVNGIGSSASASGNQLALTVSIAFQTAFSGTRGEYLFAQDNEGLYTGWEQMGTWTVGSSQQYYLTTAASPSGEGTVSPASGSYNSGTQVTITASPASGYQFAGFTGSVASSSNPLTITMNSAMTETANFTTGQSTTITSVNLNNGSNPISLAANQTAAVTVTLSANAPTGGTQVTLTANNSGLITFPGQTTQYITTVAAGSSTSPAVTITAQSISSPRTLVIQASIPYSATAQSAVVTVLGVPTLTQFSPAAGSQGASVTIAGTNFTSSASVTFNGAPASVQTWSSTQLVALVPSAATTGPITISVPGFAPAPSNANFVVLAQLPTSFNMCLENTAITVAITCPLPAGAYNVNAMISITRPNITVTGASEGSTLLVRDAGILNGGSPFDPPFTGPMIQVNVTASSFQQAQNAGGGGVTVENLTICGGLDNILDQHTGLAVSLGTSPVGCPRNETAPNTSPAYNSTRCGDMIYRITQQQLPNPPAANPNDFPCMDFVVFQADTGENPTAPFNNTGPYSLTIANVDFEDATGNALSLFETGTYGPNAPATALPVNDIYIHNSSINASALTGILYGANYAPMFDPKACDGNSGWLTNTGVFAPRNIRIESNSFYNNNTGAMGGGAVRWAGLRNNVFVNNYVHPQGGNKEGGTIEFDPCADQLQISGNTLTAPPSSVYPTDGLELYGRDIQITGNTITGYPLEGISLNGTFNSSVLSNTISNNALQFSLGTGGIEVSTVRAIAGPCGDPRDSQDITIGNNTVTGQTYGVFLQDHDNFNTNTLRRFANSYAVALGGTEGVPALVEGYAAVAEPVR